MRWRTGDERGSERGFTLIELLVVILIIGILAAIALPAFLGQRTKGQDASAKSNARNLVSQMEACLTDQETYAKCTDNTNILDRNLPIDPSMPPARGSVAARASSDAYTIVAQSRSGNWYSLTKDTNGAITRTCATATTAGGCNEGSW